MIMSRYHTKLVKLHSKGGKLKVELAYACLPKYTVTWMLGDTVHSYNLRE